MLAKLTSRNPLTLPKAVTAAVEAAEYFDVFAEDRRIALIPVRVNRADAVRAKLAELGLSEKRAGRSWSFDGDGALLRLVSEAYRIRLAYLFDPYLAVHTSRIDPLPHQITAVYGEMLPRPPLRFLLADDPGAGKTARRSADRDGPACRRRTPSHARGPRRRRALGDGGGDGRRAGARPRTQGT